MVPARPLVAPRRRQAPQRASAPCEREGRAGAWPWDGRSSRSRSPRFSRRSLPVHGAQSFPPTICASSACVKRHKQDIRSAGAGPVFSKFPPGSGTGRNRPAVNSKPGHLNRRQINTSSRLVFLRKHPILQKYLENTFQVFQRGILMTNVPVNANEAPKTPVEGAPANPAQQDQSNQPSKPSEPKK